MSNKKGLVRAETLLRATKVLLKSASKDEARMHLNGVAYRFAAERFEAVSTDGHRLACWVEDLNVPKEKPTNPTMETPVLVQRESAMHMVTHLQELKRCFRSVRREDPTGLIVDGGAPWVYLDLEREELTSVIGTIGLVCIHEDFPPWRKVVPDYVTESFTNVVTDARRRGAMLNIRLMNDAVEQFSEAAKYDASFANSRSPILCQIIDGPKASDPVLMRCPEEVPWLTVLVMPARSTGDDYEPYT